MKDRKNEICRCADEKGNPFEEGMIIAVDKPLGWTSFDVVNKFRYRLCKQLKTKRFKVGHAGTLDPLATGLVILCTGKSTKRIESLQADTKTYIAGIRLGETTPSHDLETDVESTRPYDHLSREEIERVLRQFVGVQEQIPPVFSACKIEGERAYERARRGEEVELKAKSIVIHSIDIEQWDLPNIRLKIVCGKGTYIRSLARDLGEALGCGAHLTSLRRTRSGEITLEEAIKPEDFDQMILRRLDKESIEEKHSQN